VPSMRSIKTRIIITNSTILQLLSNQNDFFPTVTYLYSKYGEEIAQFRPEMRKWCERSNSCKFCDYEIEMLYILIREIKPQRIFEMAPNRGYSTTWMLHAVSQNDDTSLVYSYDIHDTSLKFVPENFRRRWHFTKGDYAVLLQNGELQMDQFDFIFIDALHEEEFSRNYCRNILEQHKRHAIVAIHDIVANPTGGGHESAEVYKWMAFASNKVRNVFTMSRYLAPNMNYPMPNYVSSINQLRVQHKIVKPCVVCDDSLHDVLYFKNGDSPTIFFELKP
jgi:predicted O-methyltransferase YrrM